MIHDSISIPILTIKQTRRKQVLLHNLVCVNTKQQLRLSTGKATAARENGENDILKTSQNQREIFKLETCFRRLHHHSPGTMLAHSLRPVFSGQGSRLLAANKSSTISNTAATASSQFILFHRNFTATTAKLASVDGGDSSTGEFFSCHSFIFHKHTDLELTDRWEILTLVYRS